MTGMDRRTGKPLSGIAHLRQSIADVLTTPIGSRVMRRDYGSRLFSLIDTPVTAASVIDYSAAIAEALTKWEPRVTYSRCAFTDATAGRVTLSLTCAVRTSGETFSQTVNLYG
jgi:phage baseplate assembly protein W